MFLAFRPVLFRLVPSCPGPHCILGLPSRPVPSRPILSRTLLYSRLSVPSCPVPSCPGPYCIPGFPFRPVPSCPRFLVSKTLPTPRRINIACAKPTALSPKSMPRPDDLSEMAIMGRLCLALWPRVQHKKQITELSHVTRAGLRDDDLRWRRRTTPAIDDLRRKNPLAGNHRPDRQHEDRNVCDRPRKPSKTNG